MDKKTLLGIVLIGIIMIVWMIYSSSEYREIPPEQKSKIDTVQDTTRANNNANDIDSTTSIENTDSASIINKFGTHFAHFANATEELIKIETDLYSAIISNKGGSLVLWQLNQYKKWDKTPTQLINESETELFLKFTTIDAKKIDSRELYFNVSTPPDMQLNPNIRLVGDQSKELIFTLDLGDGKQLIKKITFYGDKYHIDQDIQLNNLDGILKGGYTLIWGHNLNYQEANCDDESNNSNGLISMNGEVDDFDVDDTEGRNKRYTGLVDYVALKTKYFATAIIPQPWQKFDGTVYFVGQAHSVKDGKIEDYQMAISVPYKGGIQTNTFKIFIGPIEYQLVKSYGLEATVDLGWRFLIRPIGEYLMLPLFKAVHRFVPNYGIAIIVFSI